MTDRRLLDEQIAYDRAHVDECDMTSRPRLASLGWDASVEAAGPFYSGTARR